ncbi:hypothetical protein J2X65_003512 [Ancylobacter sp. 3268]|uniref:hypothetical protein n=1 Tax=Ancylobacter sp. 3268 TaxID=2817752 RepID=UPI00285A7B43|nr:hypothetical protein [Ancylobacter sp. 3268]MDR6954144.1 hypothetical protein [Ancylobacter sp. 3268]
MIKNALHTPLRLSDRRSDVVTNAFGVDIAQCMSVDHALPLIHAANCHDDMLAALIGLVGNGFTDEELARRWSWRIEDIRTARAAIAKAEGRADG